MGAINVVMNTCLRQPKYFADCFNAVLRANGEKFAIRQELLCADETIISGIIGRFSYEKINDTKMILQNVEHENCGFLAIENQTNIHPGMAARTMIYDAFSYDKQMKEIKHRTKAVTKGDEYIAGFRKEDLFLPCVTGVLYIGKKVWESATIFQELVDFGRLPSGGEQFMQAYGNNSRLLLLDVQHVEQSVIDMMDTELKYLFGMIRCGNSKIQMLQYMHKHEEAFSHLPCVIAEAVDVICGFKLGKEILEQVTEGEVNMCKAVRDMKRDERRKGRKEGESRLNKLNLILIGNQQYEELEKVALETEYREKMYRLYHI